MQLQIFGFGGLAVGKVLKSNLQGVELFHPDIVIRRDEGRIIFIGS